MAIDITIVIAYLILIPFLLLNVAIILGRFLQSRLAGFLRDKLNIDVPYETYKERRYNLFYTILWILIGVAGYFMLENPSILSAVFVFLAFRSGANTTRRVVFGMHDAKMIREHTSDSKLIGVVSTAIKIGLLTEVLFLLIWGVAYKTLSATIKVSFGLEFNQLTLILWGAGLLFGIIFGLIRSRGSIGFLLKDELALVLLFSVEKAKEEAIKKIPFIPKF
ncbi:MAG: hypothetical protein J7L47_10255 [Candidatus Odinarchaeota archaeon]|nr:hypothetical protein [Candidatus Odinarchaeota archaeon]